jgi:hypothetical protein
VVKCVFDGGDLAFDLPDGEEMDVTIKLNGRLQELIDERVRAGIEAAFSAYPVFAYLSIKEDGCAWVSVATDLDCEETYMDFSLGEFFSECIERHEKDKLLILRKCLLDAVALIDNTEE